MVERVTLCDGGHDSEESIGAYTENSEAEDGDQRPG
jgi:hypothetical protein